MVSSATVWPNNAAYTGLRLWAQSAWQDSKSKSLSLTNAVFYAMPGPPGQKALNRAVIHRNNNWTSTGYWVGWHSTTDWAIPITKYN